MKTYNQNINNNNHSITKIDKDKHNTEEDNANRTTSKNYAEQADNDTRPIKKTVKLYYRNQMSSIYKQEEKSIQKAIDYNIKEKQDYTILLHIYYKNKKVKNMFVKNNQFKATEQHNVVYEYLCNEGHCSNVRNSYIGHTTTTIKERFKQHSSIKKHYRESHNRNITGSEMIQNVNILAHQHNKQELIILEAIFIKEHRPTINTQAEDFNRTLKIFI